MNISTMQLAAKQAKSSMPWLVGINSKAEYDELIAVMDDLVEDYDGNKVLIDLMFPVIEKYESKAPEFKELNDSLESLDLGVAMLKVIMDQNGLNGTDFKHEIGSKSTVSMILKGSRSLTIPHIKALSKRFNIPASMLIG